ncbi:MAG: MXAN_5187 C-terminal domain-containing protein [Terriglobia bacterium]
MTVEEELAKLEDNIRRLKIEYEAYFSGGQPRPPHDTVFRVDSTIKRFSDNTARLNFGQRFRFNQLMQKYAVYSDLWRRRLKEKEEGRGRFATPPRAAEEKAPAGHFTVVCSNPEKEKEKVDQLLKAMIEAKRQVGERVDNIDPFQFTKFVSEKTRQLRESSGCDKVQMSVSVEDGRVKFKIVKAD